MGAGRARRVRGGPLRCRDRGGPMLAAPQRKPPKRIGGAPFAPATPRRPLEAPGRAAEESRNEVPGSAAGASASHGRRWQRVLHGAATASVVSSTRDARSSAAARDCARCCSEDRRSATSTPFTDRAERYVCRIAGQVEDEAALEWALVQEMGAADHVLRENQRRKDQHERRVENQSQLRAQCLDHIRAKEECRQLWRRWRDEIEEDTEKFRQEEEAKRAGALEVRRQFDQDRRRQLEELQKHRRTQREAEEREGHDVLRLAEEAKAKAEADEDRRRQRERAVALTMADEARLARDRRARVKLEEAANDKRMAREQQELLEQQELQRAATLDKLREKQLRSLAQYEAKVGNELEKRAREDEERALRQQRAVDQKESSAQEAKARRLRQLIADDQAVVRRQLEDRASERRKMKEEESAFAECRRLQAEQEELREQVANQRRRDARGVNADFLRAQIQQRLQMESSKVSRDRMNEVERRMNRDVLDRAQDTSRPDGLQMLVRKKRLEYRHAQPAR